MEQNLNLESEDKISLLLTFIQRFLSEIKLFLIFGKVLLFPHKTAYISNNSQDPKMNAECNLKFNITKLNSRKLTFGKQPAIPEDEIKVSVTPANK